MNWHFCSSVRYTERTYLIFYLSYLWLRYSKLHLVFPLNVSMLMSRQDAKISSLERGMRELEEEVNMLKSNGALSSEEREEEIKQMEVYRSHSKFMKNKVTDSRRHTHTHTHTHTP